MFRRKNKHQEQPQPQAASPQNPDPVEAVQEKTYAEEVRERTLAIKRSHEQFLVDALSKGINPDELNTVLADALSAKALPRVINGMAFRGSGVELFLIDGTVPADALRVQTLQSADGKIVPGPIDLVRFPGENDNFTVAQTGLLPQTGRDTPIDSEMLAKIDAHMETQPIPTEQ